MSTATETTRTLRRSSRPTAKKDYTKYFVDDNIHIDLELEYENDIEVDAASPNEIIIKNQTYTKIVLTVPPNLRLGVTIRERHLDDQLFCIATRRNNDKALLQIGDIIESVNGILFPKKEGEMNAWIDSWRYEKKTIVVWRALEVDQKVGTGSQTALSKDVETNANNTVESGVTTQPSKVEESKTSHDRDEEYQELVSELERLKALRSSIEVKPPHQLNQNCTQTNAAEPQQIQINNVYAASQENSMTDRMNEDNNALLVKMDTELELIKAIRNNMEARSQQLVQLNQNCIQENTTSVLQNTVSSRQAYEMALHKDTKELFAQMVAGVEKRSHSTIETRPQQFLQLNQNHTQTYTTPANISVEAQLLEIAVQVQQNQQLVNNMSAVYSQGNTFNNSFFSHFGGNPVTAPMARMDVKQPCFNASNFPINCFHQVECVDQPTKRQCIRDDDNDSLQANALKLLAAFLQKDKENADLKKINQEAIDKISFAEQKAQAAEDKNKATQLKLECPICLEISEDEYAMVPCGHIICSTCNDLYMKEVCPTCQCCIESRLKLYK